MNALPTISFAHNPQLVNHLQNIREHSQRLRYNLIDLHTHIMYQNSHDIILKYQKQREMLDEFAYEQQLQLRRQQQQHQQQQQQMMRAQNNNNSNNLAQKQHQLQQQQYQQHLQQQKRELHHLKFPPVEYIPIRDHYITRMPVLIDTLNAIAQDLSQLSMRLGLSGPSNSTTAQIFEHNKKLHNITPTPLTRPLQTELLFASQSTHHRDRLNQFLLDFLLMKSGHNELSAFTDEEVELSTITDVLEQFYQLAQREEGVDVRPKYDEFGNIITPLLTHDNPESNNQQNNNNNNPPNNGNLQDHGTEYDSFNDPYQQHQQQQQTQLAPLSAPTATTEHNIAELHNTPIASDVADALRESAYEHYCLRLDQYNADISTILAQIVKPFLLRSTSSPTSTTTSGNPHNNKQPRPHALFTRLNIIQHHIEEFNRNHQQSVRRALGVEQQQQQQQPGGRGNINQSGALTAQQQPMAPPQHIYRDLDYFSQQINAMQDGSLFRGDFDPRVDYWGQHLCLLGRYL